jgi:signal transduction histidine kinase
MVTNCLEKSMVVHNRLLQTLSDIFNARLGLDDRVDATSKEQKTTRQESSELIRLAELKAKTEWFAAIAALEELLLSIPNSSQNNREKYSGLILCSPAPVLSNRELVLRFPTGVFTAEAFDTLTLIPHQLPAAGKRSEIVHSPIVELPLLPNDPIAKEAFCLVFTAEFALAMVLGKDSENIPTFHFSFEPETIAKIWSTLRSRLLLTNYQHLDRLDLLVNQFAPPEPDYRLVSNFNRQLLKNLPNLKTLTLEKNIRTNTIHTKQSQQHQAPSQATVNFHNLNSPQLSLNNKIDSLLEMELLQALTHEIRTPLTTIRTLTRLLLRRKEFTSEVIKRLESIDRECTEQIDRMELIFKAAELETMNRHSVDFNSTESIYQQTQLVPIALDETFQKIVPCWEKQAQRRNISLDVFLPKKLPKVISDPAMLDRVLTGLMENIIKSLPCEGKIGVRVTTAGDRLKLQFTSQCPYPANPFKSLGRLLMFQPETGSLSLNLQVTKNLFNALGGKLIVKQKSSQGEVLTIFLPLGNPQAYQVKN